MRQIKATWLFPTTLIATEALAEPEEEFVLLQGHHSVVYWNSFMIPVWPQVSNPLCETVWKVKPLNGKNIETSTGEIL